MSEYTTVVAVQKDMHKDECTCIVYATIHYVQDLLLRQIQRYQQPANYDNSCDSIPCKNYALRQFDARDEKNVHVLQ